MITFTKSETKVRALFIACLVSFVLLEISRSLSPNIIVTLVWIFFLWRNGFAKPGTRFLTSNIILFIVLIAALLGCFFMLIYFNEINSLWAEFTPAFFTALCTLLVASLFIFIKMRKINIDLQIRYVKNIDPDLFHSWDASRNLTELASLYSLAAKKFPDYQKGLWREYENRKKEFLHPK